MFEVEKEAEIYCSASYMGLAADPQATGIINHLKQVFIDDGKIDLPLNEISSFIVSLCKENVLNQIDNRDDEKGVAWTIALLAKAYIAASTTLCPYNNLFKECFIKYYNE